MAESIFFPKLMVQNSQCETVSQSGSHLQPKSIHVPLKASISQLIDGEIRLFFPN